MCGLALLKLMCESGSKDVQKLFWEQIITVELLILKIRWNEEQDLRKISGKQSLESGFWLLNESSILEKQKPQNNSCV